MAVVRTFKVSPQGQQKWQAEDIEGEIILLEMNGEKFLQVYSLGSQNRQEKGQRSQNLRLSKEAFDRLVEIGRKHFGEKR
jgi:hypothetical protein